MVPEEEIDYWCEEYPDLTREEVIEVLEILERVTEQDPLYQRDNNEAS